MNSVIRTEPIWTADGASRQSDHHRGTQAATSPDTPMNRATQTLTNAGRAHKMLTHGAVQG